MLRLKSVGVFGLQVGVFAVLVAVYMKYFFPGELAAIMFLIVAVAAAEGIARLSIPSQHEPGAGTAESAPRRLHLTIHRQRTPDDRR